MGCSCITLRQPCNNQRPRCDITWVHVLQIIYTTFFELNWYKYYM